MNQFEDNPIKDKKLLLVSHNMRMQGAPLSLFHLAKGLQNRGRQVEVVAMEEGELLERYEREGIKVHLWEAIPDPAKVRPSLSRKWFLNKAWFFYTNKYDLIFMNTALTFPLFQLPTLNKKKCIWCIRESNRKQLFETLEKEDGVDVSKFFPQVRKVLFVSKAGRSVYEDLNLSHNFEVIYNGLDVNEIVGFRRAHIKERLKKELNLQDFNRIFLNVGNIVKHKGQKYLVEAAVQYLKHETNGRSCFILVGGTGSEYENEVRRMVSDNNLLTQIFIMPEIKDIYKYYLIADCFLFTSFVDTCPRAIMEAMAFELPIITTDVLGIPEEVEDGKSAILIQPGDSEKLLQAIYHLERIPTLAQELGQAAFERVKERFSLERMVQNYERLFDNVLAEGVPDGQVSRRFARRLEKANADPYDLSPFQRAWAYYRDYGLKETVRRARISRALRILRKNGFSIDEDSKADI